MFESLSDRLNTVFKQLRRKGKLSEADVDSAMREVRLALLEADVNYKVVKDFVSRVRERAVGQEVSKALNPAQQVIKIVNEELVATLGEPSRLNLSGPKPRAIILVGLQGSGKTTVAGKLARLLRSQGERTLLVAADTYRPAAVQQLITLGDRVSVPVYSEEDGKPPAIAKHGLEMAQRGGFSSLIIDTAGRSQLDPPLMEELAAIDRTVHPVETLLVVDSMIGQEAVNIAQGFKTEVPLTGLILTKLDGDARGGAAISIRAVTGVPIKFLGTGEDLQEFELFDPDRLASRILGMGDVLGLIERAEFAYDEEQATAQAEKLIAGDFTLEDFLDQLRQIRKMGPIGKLLEMLPGELGQAGRQISPEAAEDQLKRTEAIINSMTRSERQRPEILNGSRRRRIAQGSGTTVQDVNRLMKQYQEMKRMFKRIGKMGMKGLPRLFG
jgi:signal recognition particle subunit SRP54